MIFKYELPSTELIVVEENNYLKFGEYLNDMQCDDTENKLFINDLEYVKQLKIQISAREENYNKLEDNWNKLKEYLEQEISIPIGGREFCCYSNVKDKIKELERGVSDVED